MKTVVMINSDTMGSGDDEVGTKILHSFLRQASGLKDLDVVAFYNTAVNLMIEGSPALQALQALDDQGVDLVACGTCVDHFGIREQLRVGEVCSMDDVISYLRQAEKVITL